MKRLGYMMGFVLLAAAGLNPGQAKEIATVGVPVAVFLWLVIHRQFRGTCTALDAELMRMVEARLERIHLQEKLDLLEGRPVQTERLIAELEAEIQAIKGIGPRRKRMP